ncbi:MAG: MBL fold metallo-hydrolase [SAR324 cluster bacterium]|nr:MBL fold metallo-hydrolase [SAR324 cluster bacterium]
MLSQTTHAEYSAVSSQDRIKQSRQYHEGTFHNSEPMNLMDPGKLWGTLKEYAFGQRIDPVPLEPLPIQKIKTSQFQVPSVNELKFARLGHSSLLLQLGGKIWLTDPVFSERASPVQWAGPKRFHPVPIALEDLPPLEGVILSHDHYDHLDQALIQQLKERTNHFIVPLGVGQILESWGVSVEKIIELDWWENAVVGEVEFISTPARHFSGRGILNRNQTLWTSWVMRSKQHSIYFSGDSGYFKSFREIGEKYGPFDIAFMENGAYNLNWPEVHMFPEQTLQAFKDLKGKLLVPIHNGTFDLSLHSWYEPMERITELAHKENVHVLIPLMGQVVDAEKPPENSFWWRKVPSAIQSGQLELSTL